LYRSRKLELFTAVASSSSLPLSQARVRFHGDTMQRSDLLVWMDLEMTGLDPASNVIIEIATLITDNDLEIVAEGPDLVINVPQHYIDAMDEWNTTHHGESGLIDQVLASDIDNAEAERQ